MKNSAYSKVKGNDASTENCQPLNIHILSYLPSTHIRAWVSKKNLRTEGNLFPQLKKHVLEIYVPESCVRSKNKDDLNA
jgi:hypothetical protein